MIAVSPADRQHCCRRCRHDAASARGAAFCPGAKAHRQLSIRAFRFSPPRVYRRRLIFWARVWSPVSDHCEWQVCARCGVACMAFAALGSAARFGELLGRLRTRDAHTAPWKLLPTNAGLVSGAPDHQTAPSLGSLVLPAIGSGLRPNGPTRWWHLRDWRSPYSDNFGRHMQVTLSPIRLKAGGWHRRVPTGVSPLRLPSPQRHAACPQHYFITSVCELGSAIWKPGRFACAQAGGLLERLGWLPAMRIALR